MLLKKIIKNKQYELLMRYAFQKCDAIMFVFRKDGFSKEKLQQLDKTYNNTISDFKHSLLKERNGAYWVFHKVGYSQLGISEYSDPLNFEDMFKVLFYRTTQQLENYILSKQCLYDWLNPMYPEDISLFKNGYCWLYSVAHEEICDIYCENEEEYEYLKSIGIEFVDDEFVPTPKEELYYEEY